MEHVGDIPNLSNFLHVGPVWCTESIILTVRDVELCSGIKGSMYKVMKSFICRVCMNSVTGKDAQMYSRYWW